MKVECASAAIADWDALSDLFQNRFLRGDYKSHLMRELRERKMTENESLLSYITSIEALCHDLDSHMSEEQIIDYIYAGLDKKIAAQIAFFAPRTVEVLLDVAKNIERGLDLMHELKSEQKHKKINAVKSSDSVKARNSQTEVLKNDSLEDKLNKVVDLLQVMAVNKNNDMNRPHSNSFQTQNKNYQNKPFNKQNNYNNFKFKKNIKCYACHKFGHIAKNCRNSNSNNANTSNATTVKKDIAPNTKEQPKQSETSLVNSLICTLPMAKDKSMLMIDVLIKNKVFKAILDSGTEVTLMKTSVAEQLNLELGKYSGPDLYSVSGDSLDSKGELELDLTIRVDNSLKHTINMNVIVVDELPADLLLGLNFCTKMGLLLDCSKMQVKNR